MTFSRRNALGVLGGAGVGIAATASSIMSASSAAASAIKERLGKARYGSTLEEATAIMNEGHAALTNYPGLKMRGNEEIAMLIYPDMTALDAIGPQYFFATMMGAKVHLVSKDPELKPVMSDTGFAVVPTIAMKDVPKDLDVFFVGGGLRGTTDAMKDSETIDFVADRCSRAKMVTSVCTGSLILGQAGMLEGKRATSHWSVRHLLPDFGAIEVNERLVVDGNVITGAGVSSGLDFGLDIVARLRGAPYAKTSQLSAEYAPEPKFNAGTLEGIEPELGRAMRDLYARAAFTMKEAAKSRRM